MTSNTTYTEGNRNRNKPLEEPYATRDITAAKETEFAVRKLNATLEGQVAQRTAELEAITTTLQNERNLILTLNGAMPHHVYAKDVHYKFLMAKQSVARSTGTTPEELLGKSDFDFSHRTWPKAFSKMNRAS